nr:uncharacterized protein LOC120975901 [Aegilops tauschii subsp. strangulata]
MAAVDLTRRRCRRLRASRFSARSGGPGARLVAQDGGRGSSWSRHRKGAVVVAGLLLGSGSWPSAGGSEQSLEVPAWMWAATAWWWLMAVVGVISRQWLDFSGVSRSEASSQKMKKRRRKLDPSHK